MLHRGQQAAHLSRLGANGLGAGLAAPVAADGVIQVEIGAGADLIERHAACGNISCELVKKAVLRLEGAGNLKEVSREDIADPTATNDVLGRMQGFDQGCKAALPLIKTQQAL